MDVSFGENLKRARKAAGITQSELARQTGITERSIHNYEKNSRAPKIDIVERLCRALEVPTELLMQSGDDAAGETQLRVQQLQNMVQVLFESDMLDAKTKEQFFRQVTMLYFAFKDREDA